MYTLDVNTRVAFLFCLLAVSAASAENAPEAELPDLLKRLNDPELRGPALLSLADLNAELLAPHLKETVPALLVALKEDTNKVRAAAAKILRALPANAGVVLPELFAAMKEHRGVLQNELFAVVERINGVPEDVLPALLRAIDDEHWAMRRGAATALGAARTKDDAPMSPQVVPALVKLLADSNVEVRGAAGRSLRNFPAAALSAIKAALTDPNADLRAGAVAALGFFKLTDEVKALLPDLLQALNDKNPEVRRRAALSLGAFGVAAREAVPALTAMLKDDPNVQLAAALALEKIAASAHADCLPVLLRGLREGTRETRATILELLDEWNLAKPQPDAPAFVPALLAAYKEADGQTRKRILSGLVKVCAADASALRALAQVVGGADIHTRSAAVTALSQIGIDAKEAVPILVAMLPNDNLAIREAAASLVARIAPRTPEALQSTRVSGECAAIRACKTVLAAQEKYRAKDWAGTGKLQYAASLKLLFETKPGAADVKLVGKAMGDAEGEPGKGNGQWAGYRFKVLTAQKEPDGTRKSYIEDGKLTGGHALLAYPHKYDSNRTFMMGPAGVVYAKDLDAETPAQAAKLDAFAPDATWKALEDVPGAAADDDGLEMNF